MKKISIETIALILETITFAAFLLFFNPKQESKAIEHSQRFQVGDCVQYDLVRETWEQPANTYKILELGKAYYRIGFFVRAGNNFDLITTNETISFRTHLLKVECPHVK